MTFLLTLLYVVLSHLSPQDLFPDLAPYRIMLWLGIVAGAAVLIRSWIRPGLWQVPQTYIMIGLTAAVPLSRIAHLWFGGAWPALSAFLVSGIVFFLVVGCVGTPFKLKLIAAAVVLAAVYLLSEALYGYYNDGYDSRFVLIQKVETADGDAVAEFPRLRAVGFLEDPNDFAQFLLVGVSFLTLVWKERRWARNFFLVLLPAAYLLYGVYTTRSRGALFGLGILVFLLLESRLSRKASAALTTCALGLLILLQAAGPRAISLSEGSAGGRVEAWGTGIALLKASPLFGVGYDLFMDNHSTTAHNSFVLCFAELGMLGYFLWLSLIVFTAMDLQAILAREDVLAQSPDLYRCTKAVRAALFTFLVTSWFLSRTYIVTFYLLVGMGVVVAQLVRERHGDLVPVQQPRWALTGAIAVLSIFVVYITVRLRNL